MIKINKHNTPLEFRMTKRRVLFNNPQLENAPLEFRIILFDKLRVTPLEFKIDN